MIRFFIALFVTTLMIVLLNLWGTALGAWKLPSFYIETIILLVFSTGLLYRYLDRASGNIFVQLYLLTIAIKLLAYGAYILAIILIDRKGVIENVAFFMVAYFVYTALEIGFLFHKKTRS